MLNNSEMFDQALDIPESLETENLWLRLTPERIRYSVRIKKSDLSAVKKAINIKFPSKIGGTDISDEQFVLCLGPDEWLIITDPKEAVRLQKVLGKLQKDFICSVTEVSHRNIGFTLSGARAVSALNVGCPIDLSLEAFPIGKTTRTVFEGASIVLTRTGETDFGLECWRSFAPYLRDFFVRIASDVRN